MTQTQYDTIEALIEAGGEGTAGDVVEWTGCSDADARRRLSAGVGQGIVERVRPGVYRPVIEPELPLVEVIAAMLPAKVRHMMDKTGKSRRVVETALASIPHSVDHAGVCHRGARRVFLLAEDRVRACIPGTREDIARRAGVAETSVTRLCARVGANLQADGLFRFTPRPKTKAELIAELPPGTTPEQAAEITGCSVSYAKRVL